MAQQQQQQQGDNSLAALWVMAGIAALAFGVWYLAHEFIVAFVFKIKIGEAMLFSLFTDQLRSLINFMQITPPSAVTFNTLLEISTRVGEYVRYPVMAILGILAVILYFSDVTANFRKTYSMKRLANQEKSNWPQISSITKLDLVAQDINEGPWAMALTPMEFARKNKLLRKPEGSEIIPGVPTAAVRKGEAKRIFTMQLGSYWEGVDALPAHIGAVFAFLACKINRDRKGYLMLIEQINRSSDGNKLNFSGYKELIKKHYNTELVQKVVQRHAYVLTVMASMIENSRSDGVVATADFLWLKPIDRPLWYMLNCIGRQTPYAEVAGPFAHWLAEKLLGRKSMVPMVDEAVSGLEIAVAEIKLTPEEVEAL